MHFHVALRHLSFLLCIALTVATGISASAQEGTSVTQNTVDGRINRSTYPVVPPDHWAYEVVRQLKRYDFIGGLPGSMYTSDGPRSRYEFAVVTARLLDRLPRLPNGEIEFPIPVPPFTRRNLMENPGSFISTADVNDAVVALQLEFSNELVRLGVKSGIEERTRVLQGRVQADPRPHITLTPSILHRAAAPDVGDPRDTSTANQERE